MRDKIVLFLATVLLVLGDTRAAATFLDTSAMSDDRSGAGETVQSRDLAGNRSTYRPGFHPGPKFLAMVGAPGNDSGIPWFALGDAIIDTTGIYGGPGAPADYRAAIGDPDKEYVIGMDPRGEVCLICRLDSDRPEVEAILLGHPGIGAAGSPFSSPRSSDSAPAEGFQGLPASYYIPFAKERSLAETGLDDDIRYTLGIDTSPLTLANQDNALAYPATDTDHDHQPNNKGTRIPEPAAMFLFGAGLIGVAVVLRRRIPGHAEI